MGFLKRVFGKKESQRSSVKRMSVDDLNSVLKINSNKLIEVKMLADRFKNTRERYEIVALQTGVPSDVIFAIHYRESSLNFKCCLHNGEQIIGTNKLTRLVPAGRGPFRTWEEAAVDALLIEKHNIPLDWNFATKLAFCERYNGLGYYKRNIPSPYVFSWTNGYTSGKYVADGKFDSSAIDEQCGCAALIMEINL